VRVQATAATSASSETAAHGHTVAAETLGVAPAWARAPGAATDCDPRLAALALVERGAQLVEALLEPPPHRAGRQAEDARDLGEDSPSK
jgi:hypothetical protein